MSLIADHVDMDYAETLRQRHRDRQMRFRRAAGSIVDMGVMSVRHATILRKVKKEDSRRVLDHESAQRYISARVNPPSELLARLIQIKVAEVAGIDFAEMFRPCRTAGITAARHIAMYMMKITDPVYYTNARIASLFGRKNEASVAAGMRKVARLKELDPAFADLVRRIWSEVGNGIVAPSESQR